jgi:hypothetical protein
MKRISLIIFYFLLAITSYAQENLFESKHLKEAKKRSDSLDKDERRANIYANRKYSFSISVSPYANIANASTINTFGVFDITFSDRLTWLDVGKNGSLETNLGIGFEPFQGTKLNIGSDYELLSKKYKVNLYLGLQYSLGLAQSTTLAGNPIVTLGYHNYLMPFVGMLWYPWKEDKTNPDTAKTFLYRNPAFRQLFYVKLQVGYSILLNKLQVDTTGAIGDKLYEMIRNNTSNTLNIKICVGINIPTKGERRKKYHKKLRDSNVKIREDE